MHVRAWILLLLVAISGCVLPARDYEDFESKAETTAEDTLSAVQTALLAVEGQERKPVLNSYLSVLISEAEKTATASQGAFESVQPPDRKSDEVRDDLSDVLDDATKNLGELRIAIRRSDLEAAEDAADELKDTARDLEHFLEKHPN